MNHAMKYAIVLLGLLLGGILMPVAGPAAAADLQPYAVAGQQSYAAPGRLQVVPFPRSDRAQSVWASRACWSECGAYCAWGMAQCLERDSQGYCLSQTDRCDRVCQSQCRTRGGPLLGLLN